MENKIVDSKVYPLKELFLDKFDVDFYQRDYVWKKKQIEDLVSDLSIEFLKNWKESDSLPAVSEYDPYYMGEIVLSIKGGKRSSIIDGQQRITTLTLFLIYLLRTYGHVEGFPTDVEKLIYDDYYGQKLFNLEIDDRKECMMSLFKTGDYIPKAKDSPSIHNLVERYHDISECWDERITEKNIVSFAYWVKEKVMFSKVWTNSDEFAYVIFETMNDRGVSLTPVEMLRSYLLAKIDDNKRSAAIAEFNDIVKRLSDIKLSSKSKAEFEFFKIYFRGHYAEDLSQNNSMSDFVRIGREFHRWVRDKEKLLKLSSSDDYIRFIHELTYFSEQYEYINNLVQSRNTNDFLYFIVNNDYGFTLQTALILSALNYNDSVEIVDEKIKVISKYLTKVLSWRVWNHYMISQSTMESTIYSLCKDIRNLDLEALKKLLDSEPIELPSLENAPILNQQNRPKIKVLLALITEIVAKESGTPDYILNKKDIEVEHIWCNHYEQHLSEFDNESDFATVRNSIGDLLLLPKSFNASYGDDTFNSKVEQYFSQNVLAQSLNIKKYSNNPGFIDFIHKSRLQFKAYDNFDKEAINERTELYRSILKWNWKK